MYSTRINNYNQLKKINHTTNFNDCNITDKTMIINKGGYGIIYKKKINNICI